MSENRFFVQHEGKSYELFPYDEVDFWLSAESGEALTISPEELFKILDQYFRDNF